MTWFQTVPTLIVAVLIIFVPGALLARSAGARGLAWAALSAPLSISLISVAAVAAQLVHLRWSLLDLLVFTVLACIVVAGIRAVLLIRGRRLHPEAGRAPRLPGRPASSWVAFFAGLLVPAAIISYRFSRIFINPDNISQTYDNVFHLNAVRFIIDTGRGSSLTLGSLDPTTGGSFYPAAWHDLVALVVEVTHVSIPVGVNATSIVLGALVWTLSCLYLASRVAGSRPAVYLITGAIASGFSAFPYLLVDFGVLYPNFLAITLLPAFIALMADLLRLSSAPRPKLVPAVILLILALPGLGLAHPSVVMSLAAFAVPLLLVWLGLRVRDFARGKLSRTWCIAAIVCVAGYLVVLAFAWMKIRPSKSASIWLPVQTMAEAIGEALTNGPQGRPVPYIIFALVLVGLYALVRSRKHLWTLLLFVVGCFLFVAASGFPKGDVRDAITGVWYNDPYRLAAMLPTVGLPIAVFGGLWLFDLAAQSWRARNRPSQTTPRLFAVGGVVAVLLVAVLVQGGSVGAEQQTGMNNYQLNSASPLLSSDESTLLSQLDSHTPANATIIENPGTGGALAYALANRSVILPAIGPKPTATEYVVLKHMNQLANGSFVCAAVKDLHAYYVLDFGSLEVNKGQHFFPSSQTLATTPGLTLLDQVGQAKLYQITACN